MAEIVTVVTSIDPLAPYMVSDDLLLELVNVAATVKTIRKAPRWASGAFKLPNLTN
jgi:hypothetical protein